MLIFFIVMSVLLGPSESLVGQCSLHILNLTVTQISNRWPYESALCHIHGAIQLKTTCSTQVRSVGHLDNTTATSQIQVKSFSSNPQTGFIWRQVYSNSWQKQKSISDCTCWTLRRMRTGNWAVDIWGIKQRKYIQYNSTIFIPLCPDHNSSFWLARRLSCTVIISIV